MKTFAASILVLLGCFGCASDEPPREMAADPGHPAGIAHDPVSHVEVRTDSPWKSLWNGTLYYFESPENKMRFDVNPEAYVVTNERMLQERRKIYPYQAF